MIKNYRMKNALLILLTTCFMFVGFSQDTFILSADSKLTIDGTSTVHDWTVTANTMEGVVMAEGNAPKQIDFNVVVADIKSERGATMDKKMHAALGKDTSPKVIFDLKEVKNLATLLGTLTIAGNSQEVEIKCQIDVSGDSISIVGEHGIALKNYSIEPPTAMFGQVIVGDDVTVKFNLIFKK